MDRRRAARAAALLLLGATAGLATCRFPPASSGSLAMRFALQSLGLEIFLAAVALAGAALSRRPIGARLGLGRSRLSARLVAVLVVGAIALSHGLDGVLEITELRERSPLASFDFTLAGARGPALWLALIGLGVAPGVAEELFFRGFVQRGLEARLRPAVAIPIAAGVFGAFHGEPVYALSTAWLGLYLGLAAHLDGGIRAAIACHALNNLLAVAVAAGWPQLQVANAASTGLGFALAAACLWAVDRRAAATGLKGSRDGGSVQRAPAAL